MLAQDTAALLLVALQAYGWLTSAYAQAYSSCEVRLFVSRVFLRADHVGRLN